MGFTGVVQQTSCAFFDMDCSVSASVFQTPCSVALNVSTGGIAPGTYAFTAPVKSYATGFATVITAILTVTP